MPVILALFILVLVAIGLLDAQGTTATFSRLTSDGDTGVTQGPTINGQIDPTDQSTWPSGDRVWNVAQAIARAEGYDKEGSNPARLNNPGDISDGMDKYGSEYHSGSNITTFPDAATGWSWLYDKIDRMRRGTSAVYKPTMTWLAIGAVWAPPNADVWATNVTNVLGVSPDDVVSDYFS